MTPARTPTGIKGLDSILGGGYPAASPTLLKGGPGTGKTVFSLLFAGARVAAGEAVVFVTCEESPERLLGYLDGFALAGSAAREAGTLRVLDFRPDLREQVAGEFDLGAMLLRVAHAVEESGARAVVIDSLQNLMLALGLEAPRRELVELFGWLRERGLTALVTRSDPLPGEAGALLEEYATDCAIRLDQHLEGHLMTRYLRVLKLRGAAHGTNNYPFALTGAGVSLLPVTETRLEAQGRNERISTGIPRLDAMVGGAGYPAGSAVMFTGRSGSAKTLFAATLARAAADQGRRVLYVSFEESPGDLRHNVRSVGIDLGDGVAVHAQRAVEMGLEDHLIHIIDLAEGEAPDVLVLDPISTLIDMGSQRQVKMLLIRFLSHLKSRGITNVLTELIPDSAGEHSGLDLSSLVDSWFRLRHVETNGELNRLIHVVKARGAATSDQVKEFRISGEGIAIEDPYIGEGRMVFGAEKATRMEQEKEEADLRRLKLEQTRRALEALESAHRARQQTLDMEFEGRRGELERALMDLERQEKHHAARREIARGRRE